MRIARSTPSVTSASWPTAWTRKRSDERSAHCASSTMSSRPGSPDSGSCGGGGAGEVDGEPVEPFDERARLALAHPGRCAGRGDSPSSEPASAARDRTAAANARAAAERRAGEARKAGGPARTARRVRVPCRGQRVWSCAGACCRSPRCLQELRFPNARRAFDHQQADRARRSACRARLRATRASSPLAFPEPLTHQAQHPFRLPPRGANPGVSAAPNPGVGPRRSRWVPSAEHTAVIKRPVAVLTIEFELGAAPISGRLLDESHTVHPFTGWVGLTHAVSTALAAAAASPQQPNPSGRAR